MIKAWSLHFPASSAALSVYDSDRPSQHRSLRVASPALHPSLARSARFIRRSERVCQIQTFWPNCFPVHRESVPNSGSPGPKVIANADFPLTKFETRASFQ